MKIKNQTKENWEKPNVLNEKAPNWRGDKVGIQGIHYWLEVNYGMAQKCDNPNCSGKSKTFEWCKRDGAEYRRKRENFIRLCRSCHRKLDKILPPDQTGNHWKWTKNK